MFIVNFISAMIRERVPKFWCIGTERIATKTGGSYLWNIGNILYLKLKEWVLKFTWS